MHTTLFVYSATGNSYHVAKRIADALGDTEIILLPYRGEVKASERIGIISPVYHWVTPKVTSEFILNQLSQTETRSIGYLFCIHTYGEPTDTLRWERKCSCRISDVCPVIRTR